ncbi:hypothetical protein HanIR_Chr05g0251391 [Helianthus annuus]|nr:hypothetical protein HanIR_Chr05g0251391 [Helianthus annuus]
MIMPMKMILSSEVTMARSGLLLQHINHRCRLPFAAVLGLTVLSECFGRKLGFLAVSGNLDAFPMKQTSLRIYARSSNSRYPEMSKSVMFRTDLILLDDHTDEDDFIIRGYDGEIWPVVATYKPSLPAAVRGCPR